MKKKFGKIIICPYHSWTYDLEGNLKAAPHIGGQININLKDLILKNTDLNQ